MKKINSVWFGARILAVAVMLVLVIPTLSYLINTFVIQNDLLQFIIKISIVTGVIILLVFSLILIIELVQDKRINRVYNKVKYKKMKIIDGIYECQYCGNRKVHERDIYCKVCGIKFIQ